MSEIANDVKRNGTLDGIPNSNSKHRLSKQASSTSENQSANGFSSADQSSLGQSSSVSEQDSTPAQRRKKLFTGPCCDICCSNQAQKSEAHKFCIDCNNFLCKTCYHDHKKTPPSRSHKFLKGSKMPKSKADKPIKYRRCASHNENANDQFCVEHGKMICTFCIKDTHKDCKIVALHILAESISSDDINQLKTHLDDIKNNVDSTISKLKDNIIGIEIREKEMVQEIEKLRDETLQFVNNLAAASISKLANDCEEKCAAISKQIGDLSSVIETLDKTLCNIDNAVANEVGPNQFIRLEDCVDHTRICKSDLDETTKHLHKSVLLFSASEEISAFLSSCKQIGKLKEISEELDNVESIPDIVFPQIIEKEAKESNDIEKLDALKRNATKGKTLNTKASDDNKECLIAGFDVTSSGSILVADRQNLKIKMVSQDDKILSSISLKSTPLAITVISETMAAVSTDDNELHFLDISNHDALALETSVSLSFSINSMTPYQGHLGVVSEFSKPPSVKMIARNGNELWSVTTMQKGTFLGYKLGGKMKGPHSIESRCFHGKGVVLVTDWKQNKIAMLDGTNGNTIQKINEGTKSPYDIAADFEGNVFVCYRDLREICVWTTDLQHCYSLLGENILQAIPQHIVYKNTTYELLVSYEDSGMIDIFQIS